MSKNTDANIASMEITVVQRIIGILMFSWYLFSPEIVKIQEGKFTKTIITKTIAITFLSILIATRLDIKYFIINYPQRAVIVFLVSTITLFIYFKYGSMPKKIKRKIKQINKILPKKGFKNTSKFILSSNAKKLKQISIDYFNKILNWIYVSDSLKIIIEIEKQAFLCVWNSLRIIILYILLFDHLIIKFSDPFFGRTFLILSMLYSILFVNRIIQKYPLKIFFITIMSPWVLYFLMYFISKDIGIRPAFLENDYLVSFLGLDTSDWLISTIKFSIFSSLSLLCGLICWIFLSLTASCTIKQIIVFLRFGIIQLPVFSELKKNTRER